MNCLAKLFDMVLCARLTRWFSPLREQAGAQAGRGCIEHIALRLITDYARRKKIKLYVTFVDYSAAYDNVPRKILFTKMRDLGCGKVMLACLVSMYCITRSIIGTAVVTACAGLRQGSPTSCLLFVLFLDSMVRLFKNRCAPDGFLNWLHLLVLMDDTVIMATTRHGMIRKVGHLKDFCNENHMIINLIKTKFMVINGDENDKQPLIVGNLKIKHCDHYLYLGSSFTSDGNTSSAIATDAKLRMCQVMKFISYIEKNNDTPFHIKLKVMNACLMTSLLYGCESWLNGDVRPIRKLYLMCVKALLGVRSTTSTDMCLVELGLPEVQALVRERQKTLLKSLSRSRLGMNDDPFMFAFDLALNSRTHTARHLRSLLDEAENVVQRSLQDAKARVAANPRHSSRLTWYSAVNPHGTVHSVYSQASQVNELERVSWTRLRLSSNSLAIEQGWWNRRGRGRLPVEERLCVCGAVQDEKHIIEHCPRTQHLREQFNFSTVNELMRLDDKLLCRASDLLLREFL